MTSYKLNFSDDWLVLFVFSWLQLGAVHCKMPRDAESCVIEENMKQLGWRIGVVVWLPYFFFLDVSISLSVCGRTLEFFLFITLFFYVILHKAIT